MEQWGLELVHIGDGSITGSGYTCCATVLVSNCSLNFSMCFVNEPSLLPETQGLY